MGNVADMAIMCICVHKLVDSGENCAKELSCGFVQGLWVHLLPFWCIVQTKQHHLIRFSVVDPQSNVFPSILTFGSRFFGYLLIHAPRILGFRILGLRILNPRTEDPQS